MTESAHPTATDEEEPRKLTMYGGAWMGVVPLGVFAGLMIWLSLAGNASPKGFWAAGWIAVVVGLLLARGKRGYAETILRGLSDRNGIVIITAFVFAGVFGQLMAAGGFVEGLLWFGLSVGVHGAAFTVLAFVAAMVFAVGTGTSVGTSLALVPVFYPVGVLLGADPMMLAVALLAGGAFGDNLAPVSDTTIVSAFTQGAAMADVVRTRFPLAITAAALCLPFLVAFGGGGEVVSAADVQADTNPLGLLMLVPFVVVIVSSAFLRRHIIESLVWGNLAAIAVGLLARMVTPGEIFHAPATRDESTGVIQDGIEGVTGAVIFVLFVLAVTQILVETGVMQRLRTRLEGRIASTVRRAELTAVFSSLVASVPLSSNAAAILLVGPSIVRPLGVRHGLAPARTANLMDCAVCSVFYLLPWHNAVIVWYGAVQQAAADYDVTAPPVTAALANPYAWAILAVILVSVVTGWNRKYATTPA